MADVANGKQGAASARMVKARATSGGSRSMKQAAASETVKTSQANKTSQAAETGKGAKREAHSPSTGKFITKSTLKAGSKNRARGRVVKRRAQARAGGLLEPDKRVDRVRVGQPERVVKPIVGPIRTTEPRVRVERLQPAERAKLRDLDALVAGAHDIKEIVVIGSGDRRVSLPRTLLEGLAALGKVFEALDRGPSVTVVADDDQAEVTSQEAADLLNVSRPYVVKLARDGVLAHHRVGNRHRFTLADVLDYRDQMRVVREKALTELAPIDGYTVSDF